MRYTLTRAAELAVETIEKSFASEPQPVFDPQGFLHLAIGRAHAAVVELGADIQVESRPRATCALCLVQDGAAFWGHVGDSRIYHLRDNAVREHSRDHSHVEMLLHDGAITREELAGAGVGLVLYPLSAFRAMARAAETVYDAIAREGHQKSVVDMMQTRDELYDVLGYHEFEKKLDELFEREES